MSRFRASASLRARMIPAWHEGAELSWALFAFLERLRVRRLSGADSGTSSIVQIRILEALAGQVLVHLLGFLGSQTAAVRAELSNRRTDQSAAGTGPTQLDPQGLATDVRQLIALMTFERPGLHPPDCQNWPRNERLDVFVDGAGPLGASILRCFRRWVESQGAMPSPHRAMTAGGEYCLDRISSGFATGTRYPTLAVN